VADPKLASKMVPGAHWLDAHPTVVVDFQTTCVQCEYCGLFGSYWELSLFQLITAAVADSMPEPAARFSPYPKLASEPPECWKTHLAVHCAASAARLSSHVNGAAPWLARSLLCASRYSCVSGEEGAEDEVGTSVEDESVGVGLSVVDGGLVGVGESLDEESVGVGVSDGDSLGGGLIGNVVNVGDGWDSLGGGLMGNVVGNGEDSVGGGLIGNVVNVGDGEDSLGELTGGGGLSVDGSLGELVGKVEKVGCPVGAEPVGAPDGEHA